MAKKRQNVPQRLKDYDMMLVNARLPYIMELLQLRGIDAVYLDERDARYAETKALDQKQENDYLLLSAISSELKALRKVALKDLSETVKLAKLMGRHFESVLKRVGLNQPLPSRQEERMQFAEGFYMRALKEEDLIAVVAKNGLSQEVLQAQYERIKEVRVLEKRYADLDGEAQQTTHDRDAKMDVLDDEMKEMRELAKLALKDKPQYLEKLGQSVKR